MRSIREIPHLSFIPEFKKIWSDKQRTYFRIFLRGFDLLLLLQHKTSIIIDIVFQRIFKRWLLNSCFVKNIYKLGEQRQRMIDILQPARRAGAMDGNTEAMVTQRNLLATLISMRR